MRRYSEARKAAVLAKMVPPHCVPVSKIAAETGISEQSLYNWRQKALKEEGIVPNSSKNPEKWSSENKFAVVLETASLNETELGSYCRKKGLYPEQVEQWKKACVNANATEQKIAEKERTLLKQEQKKAKRLEKELKRKEEALAEAAALLVLQKKAQELWGESREG